MIIKNVVFVDITALRFTVGPRDQRQHRKVHARATRTCQYVSGQFNIYRNQIYQFEPDTSSNIFTKVCKDLRGAPCLHFVSCTYPESLK